MLRRNGFKIDFKSNSCGGGAGSNSSGTGSSVESRQTPTSSSTTTPTSEQQFNIFPAIFSRQLNFHHHHHQGHNTASSKLMDELRPNLGLLGLMDDHHHLHHHHHEKRVPKTEAPDFAALYGLPNSVIENQQPTSLPSARHLPNDHSSKVFTIIYSIL